MTHDFDWKAHSESRFVNHAGLLERKQFTNAAFEKRRNAEERLRFELKFSKHVTKKNYEALSGKIKIAARIFD